MKYIKLGVIKGNTINAKRMFGGAIGLVSGRQKMSSIFLKRQMTTI